MLSSAPVDCELGGVEGHKSGVPADGALQAFWRKDRNGAVYRRRRRNAVEAMPGRKGTGRKVSGGGKARQNKDHRRVSQRGIVKGRWDDICTAQLMSEVIQGRPTKDVLAEKTQLDPDKPGLGQFYCVACARYCINQQALDDHSATAKHRRRLRMLTTEPAYSHQEANAAAGRGAPVTFATPLLPMLGTD